MIHGAMYTVVTQTHLELVIIFAVLQTSLVIMWTICSITIRLQYMGVDW